MHTAAACNNGQRERFERTLHERVFARLTQKPETWRGRCVPRHQSCDIQSKSILDALSGYFSLLRLILEKNSINAVN